ncbi:hypothetical protein T440DRAFT_547835, partial [Plenodomus tracheiphilus IPT5]
DLGTPLLHEDFLPTPPPLHNLPRPLPPPSRCSTCIPNHYCTPTCQTLDWPLHKSLCGPYTKALTQRPSPNHRLALYFPPAPAANPVSIYLEYGRDDGVAVDVCRFLGGIEQSERKTVAFWNRFLPFWIQISYDGNTAGSRFLDGNQSIGGGGAVVRGPVVVAGFDADEGLSGLGLDVDVRVWGVVREYVETRGSIGAGGGLSL